MKTTKVMPDGRAMLNIGCGWTAHAAWNNLDFGPYATLRRRPALTAVLKLLGILTEKRRRRLEAIDPDIIAWDVRKGLPFVDDSFDVVYHSNVIEHLGRLEAAGLIRECFRVLKGGGVLRVVTPDTELLAKAYLSALERASTHDSEAEARHENALQQLFEQMVREEGAGGRNLGRFARFVEKLVRGGAAARGEKHLWAYDRASLRRLAEESGFCDVRVMGSEQSGIAGWSDYHLDMDEHGKERTAYCLYVEAVKS